MPAPDPLRPRALLGRAFALWRGALSPAAAVAAVTAPPFAVAERAAAKYSLGWLDAAQVQSVPQLLTGIVATVALAWLYLERSAGRTPRVWPALAVGMKRWVSAAAVTYLTGMIFGIGLLLLVVPGVMAALTLALATPLLAATRLSANQVLRRSKSLTAGHRRWLAPPLGVAFAVSAGLGELVFFGADRACQHLSPFGAPALAVSWLAASVAMLADGFLVAALVAAWLALEARLAPPSP